MDVINTDLGAMDMDKMNLAATYMDAIDPDEARWRAAKRTRSAIGQHVPGADRPVISPIAKPDTADAKLWLDSAVICAVEPSTIAIAS